MESEKINNEEKSNKSLNESENSFSDNKETKISRENTQEIKEDENIKDDINGISNNINAESMSINGEIISDRTENDFSATGNKKKKDFGLYIVGAIVLLVVVGLVAYYFIFNNEKDVAVEGEINTSQEIIKSSIDAMKDVKSYDFDGLFSIETVIEDEFSNISKNSVVTNISGSLDENNIDYPKSSYDFSIDVKTGDEIKMEDFFINLGAMSFGKGEEAEIYLNLKDLNFKLLDENPEIQIEELKNKWYEFKIKDLKDLGLGDALNELESLEDTDSKQLDIKSIYEKYNFFIFDSDLGDEKLGDVNTYHYKVKANSDALIDFYIEFGRETILLQGKDESFSSFGSSPMEKFDEAISEFEENPKKREFIKAFIENIEIEIWIGKDDNLVYKIKAGLETDKDFIETMRTKIDEISNTDSGSRSDLNDFDENTVFFGMNMEINMSKFNQPIGIEKPKDSENLLIALMKGFMGGSMMPTDSDGDGLTDDMEFSYGTDINNPDTDGDGFSDGDEINGGYDPLLPGGAKLDTKNLLGL